MKPIVYRQILTDTSRYLLAIIFLFSGSIKAIDPVGAGLKMSEYLRAFQLSGFDFLSLPMALGLSLFEFALGATLLMGIWRNVVSWGGMLIMIFMTSLTLYLALYNPIADCGCFGEAIKLTNWQTFWKNLILLTASIYLFRNRTLVSSAFSYRAVWLPFLFSVVGFLFFTYSNYRHQPMLDFRPYKVGASLPKLILTPPDAPQDEYTYEFVYERNGERRSFNMDNLPDETWTYVERNEKLISKGYVPPISDFALFDGSVEVTEEVVSTSGMMIWVLSQNWENANRKVALRLNNLYSYAQKQGVLLYALSASTKAEEGRWRNSTGAEYPTLLLDATTVKTIARANPSILFLRNGEIIAKLNALDLEQGREELSLQVEKIFSREVQHEPYLLRLLLLIIWLCYTLVSIIITSNKKTSQQNKAITE